MRLYGGKALIAGGAQIYYDLGDAWIPLVEQRQPRYVREATLITPPFNGRDPDCVWHRLMLDACIPPGTSVRVESRSANDERDLAQIPWTQEPSLYLRSASELPFARVAAEPERDDAPREPIQPVPTPSSGEGKGTWELLFQQARGQYLQLRLTFVGSRRTTPRIRALRAYYPRFSYLEHYLPAIYRDDEQSASFLDRFLANVEGFYTAIEDRIAAVQMLFDVRSAPPDTLEWLAKWFDVALDPAWTDAKRRLFIRHAMDFFRDRGTIRGLVAAARLAIEPCADERIFETPAGPAPQRPSGIRIVEKYRTRRTPGVVFGDPTETTGPRRVTLTGRWLPEQGQLALRQRYTDYLDDDRAPEGQLKAFPIRPPQAAAETAAWSRFATETLGFVPSATSADRAAWRGFLARRYQRVSAMNSAYQSSPPLAAFDAAELPLELPADGPALQDWYQFESVVVPMRRTAHRFTVLLPVAGAGPSADAQRMAVDLARRVIELEKPAHTIFDVKFYWGMFRLGEARLGEDTLIDLGGRAPELTTPMTLGSGHLAASYLAPGHPFDVRNRTVLGGREQPLGKNDQEKST
jgi:phage tail-like protein